MEVLDGLSSGNQTSQCKKTGSAVMKPRGSIDPSVFVSGSPERPKTRHGFLSIHGLMFGRHHVWLVSKKQRDAVRSKVPILRFLP